MRILISFTYILFVSNIYSQSRVVTGRVVSEDLESIPHVQILYNDTVIAGYSDMDGYYKVEIADTIKGLTFDFVGMESTPIVFSDKCEHIEVIMKYFVLYDFISLKKADRLRYKRYKKLNEVYAEAFNKGIFVTDKPCYEQVFEKHYSKD
ncbi:hypothetical protein [Carboxylicivirga marina]|uniref:hypothetical protein n=1 Tax=Carboxylicivirga marina TaxID=2800988 RepID=UPI002591B674|nr:hypothetical protein [uncultured Carboxylicivirga sp.]